MKRIVYSLFFAALMIPASLFAQTDTVRVASDVGGHEGNLNTAILGVDSAHISNTVFMLEAGGYYILNGVVNVPAVTTLHLESPKPGTTSTTGPAQITLSSNISSWRYFFDCFGDVHFKNIWLLYANTGFTQQSCSLELENDPVLNSQGKEKHAIFDNVIFDYAPINGSVESRSDSLVVKFTNCYWRNNIDPHYVYYGRSLSWPYSSTTWHTDTVTFENCTLSNMGYGFMQESPEYSDVVSFNHCTFFNINCYALESSYYKWLNVNNCLFVNTWMLGDQRTGLLGRGTAANSHPNGGTINIDSIATFRTVTGTDTTRTFPHFEDGDRHILFTHSAYYEEQWLTDYQMTGSPYDVSDTINHPFTQPMMSTKTLRFFDTLVNGQKPAAFKYMNRSNLYGVNSFNDPAANPGFTLPPTNEANIKTFLLGRWSTATNLDWAYNITDDLNGVWPMSEALSYSNATLKVAGMGGFPLGDLYRWWPAKYNSWLAQSATEYATIKNWLTNGINTAVQQNQPNVPADYVLSQNYPNPFNPTTEIKYSVPQRGVVSLKVYNVLGQQVATLFEGERQAGNYVVTFDASGFTSGVYFYRMQSGNTSITKKLVLMK
jgi:hypothetical protein